MGAPREAILILCLRQQPPFSPPAMPIIASYWLATSFASEQQLLSPDHQAAPFGVWAHTDPEKIQLEVEVGKYHCLWQSHTTLLSRFIACKRFASGQRPIFGINIMKSFNARLFSSLVGTSAIVAGLEAGCLVPVKRRWTWITPAPMSGRWEKSDV